MVDANGILTQYSYDPRGRLAAVKAGSRTTRYGYDAFGNMTSTTLPRGNRVGYEYDGANRLVKVKDGQGNYIAYSYDTEGNRTREEVRDSTGTLKKYQDMAYDADNRLWKVTNPDATYTEMLYDGNGNVTSARDNKGNLVSYIYDALDRLTSATQPGNITTNYTYDINDNITSLRDGRNNTTTYTYDDAGKLIETTSPDTGTTHSEYDPVGNLIKKKDAKQIETDYEYDALNRVTAIRFPADHTKDVTYSYDSTANGNLGDGRLTGIADQTGSTAWYYNEYGEVIKEEKTINGQPMLVTQYAYDANGNISSVTYLDGRVENYTYDDADMISGRTSTKNGTVQILAVNMTHEPFGEVSSYTDGNGLTVKREYDLAGRLTYLKSGPFIRRQYGYDANGNIETITDLVNSAKSQHFTYDALNRLTSATGAYGSLSYEYDSVGNRTKKTANGAVTNYFYVTGTNKLDHATGAEPATYTYDENGNMISDGKFSYEYEAGGTPLPFVGVPTVPEPNVYPYVGGNPVNYIDPLGLFDIFHDFGNMAADFREHHNQKSFSWYGNWGGPGWTGGQWGTYDQVDRSQIQMPTDKQDLCYMLHDMCYSDCRKKPCESERAKCFKKCNSELADRLRMLGGDPSNDWHAFGAYMWFKFFSHPRGDQ